LLILFIFQIFLYRSLIYIKECLILGHNTLDISHLTVIAQQAWNQGVDLYGYSNNRILAISEHTSKGNLIDNSTNNFYTVPYVPYIYNSWPNINEQYTFANGSQGANRPTWGCIYHHYVNVKGLAAPYTGMQLAKQTPETGAQGCCSGKQKLTSKFQVFRWL